MDVFMPLKPYQFVYAIFFRKAAYHIFPVLINAAYGIIGNSSVKRTVFFTRKYINIIIFVHKSLSFSIFLRSVWMGSRLRGNDRKEIENRKNLERERKMF